MKWGFTKTVVRTDNIQINELLTRGVEDVFVKESLEKKLLSGKQLRIKLGIDPTGKTIHIGRASVLWKLKAFQDLGHTIVLIVGDFTALIGDPSDKLSKRPMLTASTIKENLKDYKKIIGKVIDISRVEFVYNSSWLKGLTFKEICELAESFSVQQMTNRRNFKDRIEKGEEVSLREFMYPLMQGYDSVAVKADVEIGGFDQLFNLKAGRVIQKHYGMVEQDVLTTKMLLGTDGRKMSTSWGNVINITDEANDMFGKVMSIQDNLILDYFLIATSVSQKKIDEAKAQLESGANPKLVKVELAKEIVSLYHGKEKAEESARHFEQTFSKGEMPADAKEVTVLSGTLLVDLLMKEELVSSKSDLRRLVSEGAVGTIEGEKFDSIDKPLTQSLNLRIGKKKFLKVVVK